MMRGPRRGPPHWWPEGEPWPPPDPRRYWRRHRARFIGRLALLLSVLWAFGLIGAMSVASRVGAGAGWAGHRPGRMLVGVLFVFAIVAFWGVIRRVGSPIGDLVTAARRVEHGDLDARVPVHGPPPVRAVAAAFNDMAERLAAQERQRRELMADIAHELRTPLSIVQGRLEGLIDGVYPREASQLEPLLEETRLLARLVEDLRTLANAESGVLTLDREPTDVGMLIDDAVASVRHEAASRGVTVSVVDEGAPSSANVDPLRLRQIVVNLLANAVRHGGQSATVTIEARSEAGSLVIRVSDTGAGIPADQLPHVFDRLYKRPGSSGSGLGLTIARTLARAHGGDITAESRVGEGTTMIVRIPIAPA